MLNRLKGNKVKGRESGYKAIEIILERDHSGLDQGKNRGGEKWSDSML